MSETTVTPQQLANFGRSFSLLYNRSTMYDADHPYTKQAVDDFLPVVQDILKIQSPLALIMNQDQFYIDEEPLDPRINTSKMGAHFQKAEIISISFFEGVKRDEVRSFVEIFKSLNRYPNADAMKKEFDLRGINAIKINHVFFKKVTTDEEVVSRDAYKKMSEEDSENLQIGSKEMFMDMVLESLLTEEFEKAITIKNITENPAEVSNNMIDADIETYRQSDAKDKSPGPVLMHQLQMMEEEVGKHLSSVAGMGKGAGRGPGQGGTDGDGETGTGGGGSGDGDTGIGGVGTGTGDGGESGSGSRSDGVGEGEGGADLSQLAEAVFDMKRQLINGIELQKSLGVSYSNEEEIIEKANEITDNVLIQLVKEEYQSGQISTSRLAHILKRLVPDANELRRLMPKIKLALLEEGMTLAEYMELVQELSNELESEELSKILKESAEKSGIDGEELIADVKNNPERAAELIYLAAEIRKGSGDESELTNVLVDYVEQVGSKLAMDIAEKDNVEGEENLQKVVSSVESQIVGRLRNMDVKNDVLDRLEEKLSSRMDELFETFKDDYIKTQSGEKPKDRSILEILEEGSGESEELGKMLRLLRTEAEENNLDENDFKEIITEINRHKEKKVNEELEERKPEGVLNPEQFIFYLRKEISRATRYDLPFATLSFSVVSARPKKKPPPGAITQKALFDSILRKLASEIRGADVAAILEENKLVALLPMTPEDEAALALRRHVRLLNTEEFEINGIPITVQVAGVATNFNSEQMKNVEQFIEILSGNLAEMVLRIKNIHGLT